MARRRPASVEINFDGLTDSITNLVGALILLVVLVIAATEPKKSGLTELPPPDNTAGAKRPIDPLLDSIRILGDKISTVDQTISRVENRLPAIAEEIEELKRKHSAVGR